MVLPLNELLLRVNYFLYPIKLVFNLLLLMPSLVDMDVEWKTFSYWRSQFIICYQKPMISEILNILNCWILLFLLLYIIIAVIRIQMNHQNHFFRSQTLSFIVFTLIIIKKKLLCCVKFFIYYNLSPENST